MAGIQGRIFHLNVNCVDLEASVAFYRDEVGLSPVVHTAPDHPQPGDAFGLSSVQWEAWIMAGHGGFDDVVLDVLQWRVPAPSRGATRGGFERIRVGVHEGSNLPSGDVSDPDGVQVEVVARDGPHVASVVVGCSDLDASRAFYRDVVGLSGAGPSVYCDDRGPEAFFVELTARPSGARPRIATDIGIYRLAMVVDDLDAAYGRLTAAGVRPYSRPAPLDMGPGLPGLRALFFPDPDGTTLELIERPAEAANAHASGRAR